MAEDKLIFPIGFDLQKGVEEAGKDWDKYAQKLEAALAKRAVKVKLNIDTHNFDNLDAVKQRLAQLKIEPITPETKSAIKELAAELKILAKALEQVQKFSVNKGSSSKEVINEARLAEIQQRRLKQLEQTRIYAARAEQAEIRLAQARERNIKSVNALTNAYKNQTTYLDRLIARLGVYAGYSAVRNLLVGIREVTAEFELQRVSLGAIIQDQQRANQLFSEIKSFALKSPIKILDLTKYVKQVAAYKIETDKLFDTTKRLADVSVGLGVDMGRLVLAYGQVKAASYLRAAEIRQFTEAGIPMLELLADKFQEIQGKAVSTEQVMDMVSKRAVSFSMVEEIFKDMTDAGGMFYNMQEKQAQTLFGMWSKLGDAAAVMYEQIGNVGWINDSLKAGIRLLESMMRGWKAIAEEMLVVGAAISIITAKRKLQATSTALQEAALRKVRIAGIAYNAILAEEKRLLEKGTASQLQSVAARKANAKAALDAAIAEKTAASATNIWTRSVQKLKTALSGNWLTLLLSVLAAVGVAIYNAVRNSKELDRELKKIKNEGAVNAETMARNFEFLANKAVQAADGSKAQRDALEELKRTYGDMIPTHLLTIKNLREMKENYELLTTAIREYAMQQAFAQQIEAVIANTTKTITNIQEKLKKKLKDSKVTIITGVEGSGESQLVRTETISISFDDTQIKNALSGIAEYAKDTSLTIQEVIRKAFKDYAGIDLSDYEVQAIQELNGNKVVKLIAAYREQGSEIQKIIEQQKVLTGEVGIYSDAIEQATKNIGEWENANKADKGTFKFDEAKAKKAAEEYLSVIRNIFQNSGLTFDEAWVDGKFIDILSISNALNNAGNQVSSQANKAFGKIARLYYNLVPSDEFSKAINDKFQKVAGNLKVNMDLIKKYLKTGDVDIDNYVKNFFDSIQELEKNIQQTEALLTSEALSGGDRATKSQELDNYKQELKVLKEMEPYIRLFYIDKSKGGGGGDNRLQNLKEIEQTLTAINKKYEELVKKEGNTAALDYVKENYASTLEYVNKLGKKFGLKFEMPTDFKDLQTYRKNIQKVIETLKMEGYEKAAIELELKIAEGNQDKLEKQIEKQLKKLADKISRTKTAKDFFNKILEQTGDINFATNVSMSIYGDTGEGLFEATVEQIKEAFKTGSEKHPIDIDISAAIDVTNQRINYKMLNDIYNKYQNDIIEKNRDTAKNIVREGQKTAAENILTWQKELAKAKDFEQQRTDIIKRETQRRAEIIKSNLPQEDKKRLITQSQQKQEADIADIDVKEFRGSETFIKMFENLDNVATSSLKRMREEIKRIIETDKDMSPENMKAMVDAYEKINEKISDRNPFADLIQGAKNYVAAIKRVKEKREELIQAQNEYELQEPDLKADIDKAQKEKDTADADVVEQERVLLEIKQQEDILRQQEIIDEAQLAILRDQELEADQALVAAQGKQNIANTNLLNAKNKQTSAINKAKKKQKELNDAENDAQDAQNDFIRGVQKTQKFVEDVKKVLEGLEPIFGDLTSDATALGNILNSMISAMSMFQAIMEVVIVLQEVFNIETESNPWMAIAAAVLAVVAALASFIGAEKVRKANKEIEKQQEILDQLEYSYERLEKAAEKAFGGDYIKNFKDQQANLRAQIAATQKQLAAEQSKGKKADDDKIKEYKEQIRDLKDELADMQGTLAEHFLGTDLTSAARDFAKAWLDAYKEFGKTADAMSEKFQEMIENMVVEGAMAAVMERALKPMFDMIDEMGDEDFYSQDFWREVTEKAKQGAKDADAGASTLMKFLEGAGISIRDLGGDLTGISRDIASASEESINGLAATMNTWSYYVSYVPQIAQNVAALRAILEGGVTPIQSGQGVTDLVTLQNQSLTHLQDISRHTAETVTECRRIADRCTAMAEDIHRVVVPKGTKGNYAVQTQVS